MQRLQNAESHRRGRLIAGFQQIKTIGKKGRSLEKKSAEKSAQAHPHKKAAHAIRPNRKRCQHSDCQHHNRPNPRR